MKKIFLILWSCVSILKCNMGYTQYYFYNDKYYYSNWVMELGASAGMMNCLTDIGGKQGTGKSYFKDLNWQMSKPAFSIYSITTYKEAAAFRLEASFGRIESYDKVLKAVSASTFGRYERNLSFKSRIFEIQLATEIHPLFLRSYDDEKAPFLSPYIVGGLGYFLYNPEAKLNGNWYYLRPLHTEGQGFPEYPGRKMYRLDQLNIPLGAGIRYELSATINLRLELVYRILFTDYLDDVSQRNYVDPSLFYTYLDPQQASIARQLSDRRLITVVGGQRGNPDKKDTFFTVQLKVSACLRSAIHKR